MILKYGQKLEFDKRELVNHAFEVGVDKTKNLPIWIKITFWIALIGLTVGFYMRTASLVVMSIFIIVTLVIKNK